MELSQDPKIVALRQEMYAKLREAEVAAYAYWTECDVGPERTWGAHIYELVQRAPRYAKDM